jgi:hypothetical protein
MTALPNHPDVGDGMRRDFLKECTWEMREKSILMWDAFASGDERLAKTYWQIIRLVGKEITRTFNELEGGK